MSFIKGKYFIIPLLVIVIAAVIQFPIINFVKKETSRYMLTSYRQEVKADVLKNVESRVKSKLKEDLKSEVIHELKLELRDEVLENLKKDLIKEVRVERKWIRYVNSQMAIKNDF